MGNSSSAPESDRPHLRIHAINIYVRDQDRSLRFYTEQLGFDFALNAKMHSGDRWVAVAPPDGSALLALIAPRPESREYQLIGRSTGIVFVTEDVVAKYGECVRRGVEFLYAPRLRRVEFERQQVLPQSGVEGQNRTWGGVFTHFKDVDGNSFALVGFDEVTRELEAQRRAMAQKREAEQRAK